MRTLASLVVIAALALPGAAQARGGVNRGGGTIEPAPASACGALPPAVAAKRQQILAAARAKDFERLAALADKVEFSFSGGSTSRPTPDAWRQAQEASRGSRQTDALAAILEMECAVNPGPDGGVYIWPSADQVPYQRLSKGEIDALAKLYDGKIDRAYIGGAQDGFYAGWRASISSDGRWISFVSRE